MIIGVLKEPAHETRVSLLPEHLSTIIKLSSEILVESGAGDNALASDDAYKSAGAEVLSRDEVIKRSEMILCIHLPSSDEWPLLRNKILIGVYHPLYHPNEITQLLSFDVSVFSLDMLPRVTRAQSMDVLSSQANIAGYKAVVLAANIYGRYFPMFITAAGSIAPAKVLVLGAGVAGLQAVATARRLGAVVEVFDTRPSVKEEVMSMGAKFVEVEGAADASKAGGYAVEQTPEFLKRQKEKIAERVSKSDIIITTAQIFGKKAPVLITEEMVQQMKKGSVIIDLASATGGNTSFTIDSKTVQFNGVTIVGNSNLAATLPADASKLYGKNVTNFLELMLVKNGTLVINYNDELLRGTALHPIELENPIENKSAANE